MAVDTSSPEVATEKSRHVSKYDRTRASLKEMYDVGAMPEREYRRNLKSIQRAEDKERTRIAARQAARQIPFTAAELQEALHALADGVGLVEWKRTVAPIVYHMAQNNKRTYNAHLHYTRSMLERALAGSSEPAPARKPGAKPGPKPASPEVRAQRVAAAAKARAVAAENRERRKREKEAAAAQR